MIILIDDKNRHLYPETIDDMYRVRADVFKRRLEWDVSVKNDREIDRFDYASPKYIVSINKETGEFQGSVRLLPTTGPNMLRDVFPQLLPNGQVVEDEVIWESSRFSIRTDLQYLNKSRVNSNFAHEVSVELLLGIIECAQRNGIKQIVSVYDARMARIFRRIGCDAREIGVPVRIGEVMCHVGTFPTTDEFWVKLASITTIEERVVDDAWLPAIAASVLATSNNHVFAH